ncbi:hypothetical protein RIF29_16876 [Crotalaria pallida]|uniref:Uncharacterized protein n=1 Tax=Crotalaria pallida TaxID=3830 RepID=A0AAN9IEV0_CROPI
MKFGTVGLPPYRTFTLEEIDEATKNFNTGSFMGEGSKDEENRSRKAGEVEDRCRIKKLETLESEKRHAPFQIRDPKNFVSTTGCFVSIHFTTHFTFHHHNHHHLQIK